MTGTALSLAHEAAFKDVWRGMETAITGGALITASEQQDKNEATDLIVCVDSKGRDIGMRVRGHKYLSFTHKDGFTVKKHVIDLSIRAYANGAKTELQKMREGFCSRFLMGASKTFFDADEAAARPCRNAELLHCYFVDIDLFRRLGMLREEYIKQAGWKFHPNGDGTTGLYIPFKDISKAGCVLWASLEIRARTKVYGAQLDLL
jgi:hypothetical protein